MNFLGGVDLGTPAERNRQALTRELEVRRERAIANGRFVGYHYRGAGDLLLREGQFYAGRVVPEQYAPHRGPMSQCFANALAAALDSPELTYCEGVYATGYGHAASHAWCIDPNGEIVELTMPTASAELAVTLSYQTGMPYLMPDHWAYWGVTFDAELVHAHMEAHSLPLLDRSEADVRRSRELGWDADDAHDFPLLRVKYDPNRKDLP